MAFQQLTESHVDLIMRETGEERPQALDLLFDIACKEQFGIVIANDVVISPDELRAWDHATIKEFRTNNLRGFEHLYFPNATVIDIRGS